jgi:hypothetical protein
MRLRCIVGLHKYKRSLEEAGDRYVILSVCGLCGKSKTLELPRHPILTPPRPTVVNILNTPPTVESARLSILRLQEAMSGLAVKPPQHRSVASVKTKPEIDKTKLERDIVAEGYIKRKGRYGKD